MYTTLSTYIRIWNLCRRYNEVWRC